MTYTYTEAYKIIEDAKDAMRNHYTFWIGDFSFVYFKYTNNYVVSEASHPNIILSGNFSFDTIIEYDDKKNIKGYIICVQLGYVTGDHAFIHIEEGKFECH